MKMWMPPEPVPIDSKDQSIQQVGNCIKQEKYVESESPVELSPQINLGQRDGSTLLKMATLGYVPPMHNDDQSVPIPNVTLNIAFNLHNLVLGAPQMKLCEPVWGSASIYQVRENGALRRVSEIFPFDFCGENVCHMFGIECESVH